MIRYQLPYPPSVNNLFFNVASGRGRRRTDAYKAWREAAGYAIIEQGRKRLAGPVSFSMALVRPDNRKRDLDNGLKAVLDLMVQMGVIEDDSLVQRISVQWAHDGPPCVVIVQQHEEAFAA